MKMEILNEGEHNYASIASSYNTYNFTYVCSLVCFILRVYLCVRFSGYVCVWVSRGDDCFVYACMNVLLERIGYKRASERASKRERGRERENRERER